jgi:hypothetical protein
MPLLVLFRGGGDLASGVALRLRRSGFKVIISELAQPLAVRRSVSFAEAVYSGSTIVEGCVARPGRQPGQLIAEVGGKPVTAAFKGILRGLIQPGLRVKKGIKIGDLDPLGDRGGCALVSDKSPAGGGGVLEAI